MGRERERKHTLKSDLKIANSAFVTGIKMFSFRFSGLFTTPSKIDITKSELK